MKFAVAQIGARRHYSVPRALHAHGVLAKLYTDTCANGMVSELLRRWFPTFLRPRPMQQWLDRIVPEVSRAKIRCFHGLRIATALRSKADRTGGEIYTGYVEQNRRFGELVTRDRMDDANAVYVFNGAGLEILQYAKRRGWTCVVDQTMAPIGVVESMLAEERERWPEWEQASVAREQWLPLAERERAEWELADKIICGSDFVVDGVATDAGPSHRCAVVPYGSSAVREQSVTKTRRDKEEFRVLFVGTVGLRKGVPYLLRAAESLNRENIRIRVVGPLQVSAVVERKLGSVVDLVGPMPRSEVSRHYEWADAFVLPTLAEGSANVCFEALAWGLPVITTPNSGSVVRDGLDGFIVPAGDSDQIADRILQLAGEKDLVQEMSNNAIQRIKRFSPSDYATQLVSELHDTTSVVVNSQLQSASHQVQHE